MRNINIFLTEFYNYNKRDFWIIVLSNLVVGISLYALDANILIQLAAIVLMIYRTFTFIRTASIMPSVSSDFDRYSWKYLQGLPLSKKELLIALILSNLFVLFPVIVWILSFLPVLKPIHNFYQDESLPSLTTFAKTLFYSIPAILIISCVSVKSIIVYPRYQYSRIDPKQKFLDRTKNLTILATLLLYIILASKVLHDHFGVKVGEHIKMVVELTGDFLASWWVLPFLILVALLFFFTTLSTWQIEVRGYRKLNWKPKRDIPIMTLCFLLMAVSIYQVDWRTPSRYQDNPLLRAVYLKNHNEIDHLLKSGSDINSPNQNGFTPIMVAAYEGNYRMYTYLETRGAKPKGLINIQDDNYRSGMDIMLLAVDGGNVDIIEKLIEAGYSPNTRNPLSKRYAVHHAARRCKTKVLDKLIQNKANLNVINNEGNTALHIASKDKCYGAIALLIDAGADPSIKNNEQKIARDYFNSKSNSEIAYYLDKKFRAPANN